MLLVVSRLTAHHGRIRALDRIEISVAEGELVTLIGANGAGKTTLLKVLAGVHPATFGKVILKGEDITERDARARVKLGIALVPEGRQMFGPLSVEDNLRLGGFTRPRAEAAETLGRVYELFPRLKERRRQLAGTLSGGEQQMLAIGRALMARPALLLLDEPSMGLAPLVVEQIFETIEGLKGQGVTTLLVEQNAYQALAVADRGYVVESGRVVIADKAPMLRADPQVRAAYLGL